MCHGGCFPPQGKELPAQTGFQNTGDSWHQAQLDAEARTTRSETGLSFPSLLSSES